VFFSCVTIAARRDSDGMGGRRNPCGDDITEILSEAGLKVVGELYDNTSCADRIPIGARLPAA